MWDRIPLNLSLIFSFISFSALLLDLVPLSLYYFRPALMVQSCTPLDFFILCFKVVGTILGVGFIVPLLSNSVRLRSNPLSPCSYSVRLRSHSISSSDLSSLRWPNLPPCRPGQIPSTNLTLCTNQA